MDYGVSVSHSCKTEAVMAAPAIASQEQKVWRMKSFGVAQNLPAFKAAFVRSGDMESI
jgi:hypothetical protein